MYTYLPLSLLMADYPSSTCIKDKISLSNGGSHHRCALVHWSMLSFNNLARSPSLTFKRLNAPQEDNQGQLQWLILQSLQLYTEHLTHSYSQGQLTLKKRVKYPDKDLI